MGVKNWQARGRVNAIGALLIGVLLTVSLFPCHVDPENSFKKCTVILCSDTTVRSFS